MIYCLRFNLLIVSKKEIMSISLTSSYHSIKGVDCIYEHSNEIEENSYIARKLKEIIISLIT